MAGRKRVLSAFQTMFIQMPCFRCRLVNISKGFILLPVSPAPAAVRKSSYSLSEKVKMRTCSFCLPGQRTRSQKTLTPPPPHLPQWERKCFYFLGKSCQKTPRSELCTGLPLPAQGSCQPLFFLLACGEGSRPVLDSVPLPTVPTGSL